MEIEIEISDNSESEKFQIVDIERLIQGQQKLSNTQFCERISQIDKSHHYDQESFFQGLSDLLFEVSKLSEPIKYEQVESKPKILLFGEVGNGKTTTGNFIIKNQVKKAGGKFLKKHALLTSKSIKVVANSFENESLSQQIFSVIDTPGFNDPEKQRSDQQIFTEIVDALHQDEGGLASFLQCVMVHDQERINDSAVELMSKMLQVFTLSYPDSDSRGPLPMVLFTNFSAYETSNEYSDGEISFDDEEQSEDPQGNPIPKENMILSLLIDRFKDDLVIKIMQDQSMDSMLQAQQLVDRCLPRENFFAFKNVKWMSKERQEFEKSSIEKIIEMTNKHGNYKMVNIEDSFLQPILSTNDCVNHMINALEGVFESCKHQTTKAIQDFQTQSEGKKSEVLDSLLQNIKQIQNKILKKIVQKPFCLLKLPLETMDIIQKKLNQFIAVCSITLQQELTSHKKIREEMLNLQNERVAEHEKQIQIMTEQLNLHSQVIQDIISQRRKNVYKNEEKPCWNCTINNNMVKWSPDNGQQELKKEKPKEQQNCFQNENEWECEKCKQINIWEIGRENSSFCVKCNKVNLVVREMIQLMSSEDIKRQSKIEMEHYKSYIDEFQQLKQDPEAFKMHFDKNRYSTGGFYQPMRSPKVANRCITCFSTEGKCYTCYMQQRSNIAYTNRCIKCNMTKSNPHVQYCDLCLR